MVRERIRGWSFGNINGVLLVECIYFKCNYCATCTGMHIINRLYKMVKNMVGHLIQGHPIQSVSKIVGF